MTQDRLRVLERHVWRVGAILLALVAGLSECAALWRARRLGMRDRLSA